MRRILLAVILVIFMATPAAAQDSELYDTGELLDAVPDEVLDLFDGWTPTDSDSLADGVSEILTSLSERSGSAVKSAVRCGAVVLAIMLLCSVVDQFTLSMPSNAVTIAGVLAITAACAGSLNSLIELGRETMDQVQVFANVLLPTMAAATMAVGGTTASTAIYSASVLFSNLLINLMTALLLPLVYAYLALCAADTAIGHQTLRRMAELVKWIITNSLKWLLLAFTAYLSVTGVIAGSADAAKIRAAKLAFSGAVPVVGSIIADASETVLVSASLLRNSVGVFGMLVVLGISAWPFLRIGVQYLIFKVVAALAASIGEKRLVNLVDSVSSALGFLLAMTGADSLLLLISCVCSMKVVNG